VKKIIIWYKFLLLLNRVFLEQILTHSLLKGIEIHLKLFVIYTLEILVGALLKRSNITLQLLLWLFETKVLTHYNCCWGPIESKVPINHICC